jgi:hypothetical protein
MELVASEPEPTAIGALSAPRIFRGNLNLRERIATLIRERASPKLQASFDRGFGAGVP